MIEYHYQDLVDDKVICSQKLLESNGLRLLAVVEKEVVTESDLEAQALADLPKLIGKKQRSMFEADSEQMWRYYNNVRVAKAVLDGSASPLLLRAFIAMLKAYAEEYPDYYGAMDAAAFSQWLLDMDGMSMMMGLELEAERIRQRRGLRLGG